jgi:uncharacterized protein YodC (DUF2158 family)
VVHHRRFKGAGAGVASFTGFGGWDVCACFAKRIYAGEAAAVAGRTASGDASMVHCRWLEGAGRFMTGLAGRRCRDVRSGFALSGSAVMAASTTRSDTSVVHGRTSFEAGGVLMASLASRCGWDVRRWLGFHSRKATAVASRATSGNAAVVHHRWFEGGGAGVTGFTGFSGWNVTCGWLAFSGSAVVTARAASRDAGVIHRCASFEAGGVFMASLASHCRSNVVGRFGFHSRKAAAVAGRTACGNASVVHHGRFKRYRGFMTGLTGFASGWDMRASSLTKCDDVVVACCAACADASVVHRRTSFEAGGIFVASFTSRCGGNVIGRFGFHPCKGAAVASGTASGNA